MYILHRDGLVAQIKYTLLYVYELHIQSFMSGNLEFDIIGVPVITRLKVKTVLSGRKKEITSSVIDSHLARPIQFIALWIFLTSEKVYNYIKKNAKNVRFSQNEEMSISLAIGTVKRFGLIWGCVLHLIWSQQIKLVSLLVYHNRYTEDMVIPQINISFLFLEIE